MIAPILWIFLLVLSFWLKSSPKILQPPSDQDEDSKTSLPPNRRHRRYFAKQQRRRFGNLLSQSLPKTRNCSAQFHRSYPLRLRTRTQLATPCPTMAMRQQQLAMDNLLHQVLRLHARLNKLCMPRSSATNCEGGRHKYRNRNHARHSQQPCQGSHQDWGVDPPVLSRDPDLSKFVKATDSFRCHKYNPVADGGLGNH